MWLDNLKIMKDQSGMTTKEISRKSGIPEPTLEKLFAGVTKDPKLATMQQLVHFFGYTLDDLDDKPNETPKNLKNEIDLMELSEKVKNQIKKYRSLDDYGQEAVDSVLDVEYRRCEKKREADKQEKILAVKKQKDQMESAGEIAPKMVEKLIYVYPAAAGNPLYAESDFERLEFPEDSIPYGADFGIRISGKSMEPTIKDGAIVWVHKVLDLEDGAVGVFMLNDSAVCKRFYRDKWRNVRLESDNPAFGPVEVGEFDTFTIVGKVIGSV